MAKVKKPKHIAVAGNIGAGKTTLTELLSKHYKWIPHFEDVDHNPYLMDFYEDMPRWSFNLQIYFLNSRLQQMTKINFLKMRNIWARLYEKLTASCMDYFKDIMRVYFLFIFLFFTSSVMAQSLKDSLFGGKLKADTSKTFVSKDTGKYVPPKIYNASVQGETKKGEVNKLDESMPDSLNKTFYSKQKFWKRFIDINTTIISQQAADTRKVKKGEYSI